MFINPLSLASPTGDSRNVELKAVLKKMPANISGGTRLKGRLPKRI